MSETTSNHHADQPSVLEIDNKSAMDAIRYHSGIKLIPTLTAPLGRWVNVECSKDYELELVDKELRKASTLIQDMLFKQQEIELRSYVQTLDDWTLGFFISYHEMKELSEESQMLKKALESYADVDLQPVVVKFYKEIGTSSVHPYYQLHGRKKPKPKEQAEDIQFLGVSNLLYAWNGETYVGYAMIARPLESKKQRRKKNQKKLRIYY